VFRPATTIACLLLTFQSLGLAFAQDSTATTVMQNSSISDRIKDAKHIGLAVDEKLGGFTLHIYTPDQQKRNLESLAAFRLQRDELQTKLVSFDKQRREAQLRGASVDELNAITQALNDLPRPSSPFAAQISLNDVVFVGTDYIELQSVENPDSTTLIPFAKIIRVRTPKEVADSPTRDPGEDGRTKR
jgi:hypothetical protein